MLSKLRLWPMPAMKILALFLLTSPFAVADDLRTQSIASADGLGNQRPCAYNCFFGYDLDRVGYGEGCGNNGVTNHCYCRADLQPIAYSYLSGCVKSVCTPGSNALDIQTATSLYSAYCANIEAPSTAPQTTSATTTSPVATSTTASANQNPNSYITSTVPPATTTATQITGTSVTITKVSTQAPETITKVLVPESSSVVPGKSAASVFSFQLSMVLMVYIKPLASLI